MTIDLPKLREWSSGLQGLNASKPMALTGGGRVELLEPRSPPGCWTRFKAALVNLPLIGRLDAIQAAHREVRTAAESYSEIRDRAVRFRDDFHRDLAASFGEEIAANAIAAVNDQRVNTATPGLTARKVVQIMDKAEESVAIGRTNDEQIRGKYSSGKTDATESHRVAGAGFDVRFGIARMQAIAAQPAYFRRPLTPDEVESAAPLARQLERSRLDPQILAPLADLYAGKLDRTPLHQRPQVAAQGIAACIEAANRHTIGTELEDRASGWIYGSESTGGSSSSREAPAASLEARLIALLCAHTLSHEAPLLTPEAVRTAADELDRVHRELHAELPQEMPWERIDAALQEAAQGRSKVTPSALLAGARQCIVVNELKRLFNSDEPDSTLWNAVIEGAGHNGVNANLTALSTVLAREMLEYLEGRTGKQSKNPWNLETTISEARQRFIENTRSATSGHIEALESIDTSTTLSAAQKKLLKGYAEGLGDVGRPRRLDPVQLRSFEAIADAIAGELPRLLEAAGSDEPAQLFDSMNAIGAAYSSGLLKILQHADSLWLTCSFDGPVKEKELFDLCVKLALAKPQVEGPLDQGARFAGLASPVARSDAAAPGPQLRGLADAVSQFRDACEQSPSPSTVSKLETFYEYILRGAGVELAPPDMPEPLTALNRMQPELLVRAFPDCRSEEGAGLDARGVLIGSAGEKQVLPHFDPETHLHPERYGASLAGRALTASTVSHLLPDVLGEADVIVNGRRLSLDARDDGQALLTTRVEDFLTAFKGESRGTEWAAAASICMSRGPLQRLRAAVDAAAFDPPMTMTDARPVHEVWRDSDGSWRVRSTLAVSPTSQGGRPVNTDGVVLYSLTHSISPDAQKGDRLRATLAAPHVVFAF